MSGDNALMVPFAVEDGGRPGAHQFIMLYSGSHHVSASAAEHAVAHQGVLLLF